MTNQADTAVNKELAQELEGEGSAETQAVEASEAAEVSLEASEQVENSAIEAAPEAEPEASLAEPAAEPVQEAVPQESSAPEAVTNAEDTPVVPPLSADDEDTEVIVNEDGSTQVVRMLAVGQQVEGVVKRITDFGAFVDIGVGRDGLIHISEMSTRRVAKVTDVLSEGQAITPWIKKLDRQRNRISLTLIDPEMKTIRDLETGDLVEGTVSRILPYGAFVDIGIGRDALLHVREMGEGFVAKPEDVVQVGEKIEARIIELSRRRGRVDLSLKGLREEPAPVATEQEAPLEEPAEEELADQFEEIEVLSPMELAFKKAMEAEGIKLNVSRKRQGKRGRRDQGRSIQDEIIARTLDSARK
jgi:predicted RNA-binding protein with RPS1 domain